LRSAFRISSCVIAAMLENSVSTANICKTIMPEAVTPRDVL